jgi:hypothetical protein
MKRATLYIFLIIFITIQVTWYALLWVSYSSTPSELVEADFRAFYAAGSISNQYGMENVYNLDLEQKFQEAVTGDAISRKDLLSYNHPPILLPILALFSRLQYQAAYSLYCLFLFTLTGISLISINKILRIKNWSTPAIRFTLIASLMFEPLFISVLKGQDSALLLLGLVIWFTGFIKDDDRQAGLGLALTIIRPQISLFLAIPFLFRRRKGFGWYFLGAGLLVIYSYLLVGKQGFLDYLALLKLSSVGQDYGLNLSAMFNLTGIIVRFFPGTETSALLGYLKWGFFGLALLGMIIIWIKSTEIRLPQIVLLVISSLFFSPHMHYHDLAALLIPLIAMLIIWNNKTVISEISAPMVILIISIFLIIGSIFTPAYFIIPYLLMIFILAGSWRPERFIFHHRSKQGLIG